MTDYMKEAKRLAQAYADAVLLGDGNDEALAALLAHIQRGVPEGWQMVQIDPTPEMLDAAEKVDWGDEDMRGSCCNQWHAMLAAAPDHFRDAAGMVAKPADTPDEWEYYYKDSDCPAADSGDQNCICWHDEGRGPYNNARHDDEDTFLEWRQVKAPTTAEPEHRTAPASDADIAVYQSIADGYSTRAPVPAEVPMPEPVAYAHGDALKWLAGSATRSTQITLTGVQRDFNDTPINTADQMRNYGDAREAAGYARGLAEAGRDAERYRWLRDVSVPPHNFYLSVPDEFAGVRYAPTEVDAAIDASIDALRGEVPMPKPTASTYEGYRDSAGEWHAVAYSSDQMRAYGDAREDAGYERGLKSRVPLDAINKMLADGMDVAVANGANSVSMPDHYVEVAAWTCGIKGDPVSKDAERYRWLCDVATEQQWVELGGYTVKNIIDGAIDTALRGEVKL